MEWKKEKFDATFSRYTSGDWTIWQDYESGWNLVFLDDYKGNFSSLREAKEAAESWSNF